MKTSLGIRLMAAGITAAMVSLHLGVTEYVTHGPSWSRTIAVMKPAGAREPVYSDSDQEHQTPTSSCLDMVDSCGSWAQIGECARNEAYMQVNPTTSILHNCFVMPLALPTPLLVGVLPLGV